jgi:protoporphyrinogen oxidase
MPIHVEHLIIGAGPTGLGAANRLAELGRDDFLVLEAADHVGGLSASFVDAAGFTWDIGGHVIFSHYPYFDRMLDALLGEDKLVHQRESWVRIAGTWVPYPFQNNIRRLPAELAWECVEGMLGLDPNPRPTNFREWFEAVLGPGVARLFMAPYNFKVWATPPELMDHGWIGERVSVVDVKRVVRNIVLGQDDVSWGPNNTFSFPLHGGTGEIFRRLAARVGDRIRTAQRVVAVDAGAKTARTDQGLEISYGSLLSTMPLDILAREVVDDLPPQAKDAAADLAHNSVYVGGVGVEGMWDDPRCWMYFPESDCPFYRTTNFHNYSPRNVANPGAQRALMTETAISEHKPEDTAGLMERTIAGLVNTTLLDGTEPIATTWEHRAEYGYPVPTLGRDAALAVVQPALEALGIHSRGRFGGWKYEVGNMDHSVMQGVEWADLVVKTTPETTYPNGRHDPDDTRE